MGASSPPATVSLVLKTESKTPMGLVSVQKAHMMTSTREDVQLVMLNAKPAPNTRKTALCVLEIGKTSHLVSVTLLKDSMMLELDTVKSVTINVVSVPRLVTTVRSVLGLGSTLPPVPVR